MAKFNAKEFLLNKGEKIILGAALAGMGLFAVLGISEFASAENPTRKSQEFKDRAQRITAAVNRDDGGDTVPKLPEWVDSKEDYVAIAPEPFRSPYLPFETVDTQSSKRDNPAVLGITFSQIDLVRAPIKAYEVLVTDRGVEIGLLENVKVGDFDVQKMRNLMQNLSRRTQNLPAAPPPPQPQPQPQPPQPPQGTVFAPAAMGGRGARDFMPPGSDTGQRSERTIRYVLAADFDKESQKEGVLPALSVYPVRMIVVNASFPLKEQLEVIRRALRLKTIEEAAKESAPPTGGLGPTFAGFEVERRMIAPNGREYDWAPYDHVAEYQRRINIRKFADQPDDGHLAYFLRYDQMMAMPLPALAMNVAVYPGVQIPTIVEAYKKLLNANKPPENTSALADRLAGKGSNNPFLPSGPADVGPLGGGAFGTTQPAPGIMDRKGMRAPTIEAAPSMPGAPMLPSNLPELENLLIRFLDVDIRPGFTYEYRLRVKMKNPNHKKKDLVQRPSDADQEILYGPWVAIAGQVHVPFDQNMYAGDPVAYSERVRGEYRDPALLNLMDNRNGEVPVVQFQKWTERIPVDTGKSEPAGYWVVAEVPVNRGEFVGRKQLLPLPMWSSEKVAFILQELPKYSVWKAREKPKGLLVDFSTETLMVDYEGGKERYRLGERNIDDVSDVEMLLLKPDGTVSVRNSGIDAANADRKAREEQWRRWLDEIRRMTETAGPLSGTGGGLLPGAP